MSDMPVSMHGPGVRTTTNTDLTVPWAVYRPQSSRVAVLLPVGLRPPCSSTASLFPFPNPYSRSTWTENRGIPPELTVVAFCKILDENWGETRNDAFGMRGCTHEMDGNPNPHAIRTLQQVADIMTERGFPMTRRAVWFAERRALRRLRSEKILKRMFEEMGGQPNEEMPSTD